jgi:predicted GIY-YIG superfamily endonuclease
VIKLNAKRLHADGRCPSPDTKCFYVGQTSKTPEERFAQHMTGKPFSRVVRKYGVSLRKGMTKGIGPFSSERAALRAEKRLADNLKARKGYKVWGGQGEPINITSPKTGTTLGSPRHAPSP